MRVFLVDFENDRGQYRNKNAQDYVRHKPKIIRRFYGVIISAGSVVRKALNRYLSFIGQQCSGLC